MQTGLPPLAPKNITDNPTPETRTEGNNNGAESPEGKVEFAVASESDSLKRLKERWQMMLTNEKDFEFIPSLQTRRGLEEEVEARTLPKEFKPQPSPRRNRRHDYNRKEAGPTFEPRLKQNSPSLTESVAVSPSVVKKWAKSGIRKTVSKASVSPSGSRKIAAQAYNPSSRQDFPLLTERAFVPPPVVMSWQRRPEFRQNVSEASEFPAISTGVAVQDDSKLTRVENIVPESQAPVTEGGGLDSIGGKITEKGDCQSTNEPLFSEVLKKVIPADEGKKLDPIVAKITEKGACQATNEPLFSEVLKKEMPVAEGKKLDSISGEITEQGHAQATNEPLFSEVLKKETALTGVAQPLVSRSPAPKVVECPTLEEVKKLIQTVHPEALEKARTLYFSNTKNPDFLYSYVNVLISCTRLKEACKLIEGWKAEIQLDELPIPILYQYVNASVRSRQHIQVLELIDKTLSKITSANNYYFSFVRFKSKCLFREGKQEEAILLLERSLNQCKQSSYTRGERAIKALSSEMAHCAGIIVRENTKTFPMYEKCKALQTLAHKAREIVDDPILDVIMKIRNVMEKAILDLREADNLYHRAMHLYKTATFVSESHRHRLYFESVRLRATLLYLQGNVSASVKLGEEEVGKQLQFMRTLKHENPSSLLVCARSAEAFITAHCVRLVRAMSNGSQRAMEHIMDFFAMREECLPEMVLMTHCFSRLLAVFDIMQSPEAFRTLLGQLEQGSVEVEAARVRLDLRIQQASGCLFTDILKRTIELRKKHPFSSRAQLLEGEVMLHNAIYAFAKVSDDRYQVLEKARNILDQLIRVTDHHSAYTWRGHLAFVENDPVTSAVCHQKSRELFPGKISSESFPHTGTWRELKDKAAQQYLSEK